MEALLGHRRGNATLSLQMLQGPRLQSLCTLVVSVTVLEGCGPT